MPSAASVPAPDATVKQAFEELQRRFDYDPKVTEKILELGVRSMSDFRFYPADAADAAASFVESITDLEGKRIQAARLKAAWSAVCKAEQARHDGAAPVELDEEELLPPQTLQGIKQAFFTRYKMHFPAEQFPGDRLITKLSRGLAKSNLEVFPILQVKTLGEQRVQVVKKRKVAPNLWYSSGQDDAEAEKSASKYLDLLYTYCLGLAIVGAEKPDNPPTEAETLSASTLAYCKVPWDVVYRYHFRAADFIAKLGEHHPHRLQVLEKLDTAERTMWAAEFSKGGKTLGAVINEAYTTRDPSEEHPRGLLNLESEYTAALSFSLAVAASYWAVRQGFAILRLGSMPKIECAGVLDVWDKEQGLPEDVVYAGHGHFRHRLPCSQWCNPFKATDWDLRFAAECMAEATIGMNAVRSGPDDQVILDAGKKRVIDDAAAGGQSRLSQDGNHLKFCSALQPCTHLKCLEEAMQKRGKSILQRDYAVSTIGEDLPDAYRKIPMLPAHSQHCLVTYWHKERRCAMYRRYHSMLFGLPLAVSAFNRVSSFLQAVARRILCMLCSLYFDDATAQDFDGTALVAQQSLEQVAEAVGFPFSEEKRQPPTKHGDFLGVVHDLDFSHRKPFIKLWIRLVDIKERQYASTSELTPELANALRTVQQLLHLEYMPLQLGKFSFMRDVVFYIISVLLLYHALHDQKVTLGNVMLLLVGAVVYILTVIYSTSLRRFFSKKSRERRMAAVADVGDSIYSTLSDRSEISAGDRVFRMSPMLNPKTNQPDPEKVAYWKMASNCKDPFSGTVLRVRVDLRNRLMDRGHRADTRFVVLLDSGLMVSTLIDPRTYDQAASKCASGMVYQQRGETDGWHHGGLVGRPMHLQRRESSTSQMAEAIIRGQMHLPQMFCGSPWEVIPLEDCRALLFCRGGEARQFMVTL
ncbi:unnamed protein product [Effrenium voratum]|nr:unnamed protein product [Effrenium voratum]